MVTARPRRQAGFTVTELMVVVAIVGIIGAIAAPDMVEMIRRQRVKTAAFDLYAGLSIARSEAIKRNLTVRITPNSGNWTQGFVAQDSTDRVVRSQGAFDSSVTITGPNLVRFNSTGRLASGSGTLMFSVMTPDVYGNHGKRCVTVDGTGRATSKEGAC